MNTDELKFNIAVLISGIAIGLIIRFVHNHMLNIF